MSRRSGADAKTRFSDRVADYVRHRPGYPAAVCDVLMEEIGLAPSWVVADIGSGTGLAAALFLARGHRVMAVEPNAAMRAAAEARFGDDPRFHSIAGSAEATGLPPESVDLVVAAQAFHWFDATAARAHFEFLLRAPRRIVLLWNTRRTEGTPFLKAYEALLHDCGTDYQAVRHDRSGADAVSDFFRGRFVRRSLPNEQVLDLEGLEGRLLSSSYTPAADDPARGPMLDRLRCMFQQHQRRGRVRIEYETEIYIGTLD